MIYIFIILPLNKIQKNTDNYLTKGKYMLSLEFKGDIHPTQVIF